ncbi:MAG TPA: bifunctional 4-hydroxy-2-oxoglutarate aldolase/2-dehydro-3-deoxy-phosphogluconate aldolase, partial [Bacteroidota bacterium]|nr:bifunctional 4-hydroxy-2-oxoglutarate aldolase/2-dehydro-3-deoxy-phosphogluconate aldolase [Bacteroidota bacterium]
MNSLFQRIGTLGVVPVIVIDSADDAMPLAEALSTAGLPCAEVTFRTAAAREAIRNIAQAFPEMLVGAGTVLTPDQVKAAVDAGARFIVSPGTSEKVVGTCADLGVPVMPGVATPTEVQMALDLGVEVMKFFPAEAAGGVTYLKALSAPFKQVRFVPTGGIDESNMLAYLT